MAGRSNVGMGLFLVWCCSFRMQCRSVVFRLNSAVIHWGEAPTHGHYGTLLFDDVGSQFWLTDDGSCAVPVDHATVESFHSDIYLLVYKQC